MQRNLGLAFWGLVAAGVLAVAACFPDVMFGTGGSGTQASSSSGHTSSSSGGTGGSTTTTTSTTTVVDVMDAGCESGDPCDCDGDHFKAATPECHYDGGDCDDHDPIVHPNQPMNWFTTKSLHGLWNYNCGPSVEYQYTDSLACGPVACDATMKLWTSKAPVPGCGESGSYGVCMGIPLACSEVITGPRTQGCH